MSFSRDAQQSVGPRSGFTLIELMVAMALTLFIMVILSQAFILALDTFSGLKGIGDMQANLRVALTALREDLKQDHFEGKRRVSDPTIVSDRPHEGFFSVYQGTASTGEGVDADGVASYKSVDHVLHFAVKRKGNKHEGFFYAPINQPNFQGYSYGYLSALAAGEATLNLSNVTYTANITLNSPMVTALSATSGLAAGQPVFGPDIPVNTIIHSVDSASQVTLSQPAMATGNSVPLAFGSANFGSPWAEVAYYLVQTGTINEPANPSASTAVSPGLYSLYRAQLVVVPSNTSLVANGNTYAPGISCSLTPTFFAPGSLAADPIVANTNTTPPTYSYAPQRALSPPTLVHTAIVQSTNLPAAQLRAATLLLPNVLSFNIRVMVGSVSNAGGTTASFSDIPSAVSVGGNSYLLYDSATAQVIYNLSAVQCTIRVWDGRSSQARQATIVQDL